jgi:hypothetical protein
MGLSKQLRAVFFGTALVVAAFSTGISFLFFLVYLLAILLLASRWYARRGLRGLRAGYRVLNPRTQVGDVLEAVYRVDNDARWSKPWVEVSTSRARARRRCPGGPPVALQGHPDASWELSAGRAARTDRGSLRALHERDGGRSSDLDHRLPEGL